MNINNKYNEFKHILSGCRTCLDAYYFGDLYIKRNPEMKDIVMSMINGKRYDNIMDCKTMIDFMETINKCTYQDEAEKFIDITSTKQFDPAQSKTLKRIANSKQLRNISFKSIKPNIIKLNMTIKECPHCGHNCIGDNKTKYIICGYSDTKKGYDLEGCGKEWCFKCGKILCKSWNEHKLFNENNRIHNNVCCKEHSIIHNKIYPNDYCQCINRKELKIDYKKILLDNLPKFDK